MSLKEFKTTYAEYFTFISDEEIEYVYYQFKDQL